MNGDMNALDKLSAHIARAIVQQIATVSASGQTPPATLKLDLRGYIDGDVSSSIDFVKTSYTKPIHGEYSGIPHLLTLLSE
jgi:hypothetical protein